MNDKKVVVIGAGNRVGLSAALPAVDRNYFPSTAGISFNPTQPKNKVNKPMRNSLRTLQLMAGFGILGKHNEDKEQHSLEDVLPNVNVNHNFRAPNIFVRTSGWDNTPYADKFIHPVLREERLHDANRSEPIKDYQTRNTILKATPLEVESGKKTGCYSLLMMEVPYNTVLNTTKPFKFAGEPNEVFYKRVIMFIYMKSNKRFKETVLTFSQLGEGVTRENFTKSLRELSTNVKELYEVVIEERVKEIETSRSKYRKHL